MYECIVYFSIFRKTFIIADWAYTQRELANIIPIERKLIDHVGD